MLRESADPLTRIPSMAGVLLITVAAGVLSYGVVESSTYGWLSVRTLLAIGVGVAALLAFIAHQRRTSAPALDLELFAIRNFRWGNLAAFAFGLAFSAMFFGSILFLTEVWGWSVLQAGFGVAPGPVLVAVMAPRMGGLAGRIGQRPLLIAGGLLYAAGGLYRVVALGPDVRYVIDYLPSMLLTGMGVALCLPQLSSVVAQAVPANRIGVGCAVMQAVRQLGGTFGVAVTLALLAGASGAADVLGGFDAIWWVIVAGGVTTTILSLPLRTPRAATDPVADAPVVTS